MNCAHFKENISLYIDKQLNDHENKNFEAHISECDACKAEYLNIKTIVESINDIKEVELPKNYNSILRQKLENEKATKKRKFNLKKVTSIAAGFLIFLTSIGFLIDYGFDLNKDMSLKSAEVEERSHFNEYSLKDSNNDLVSTEDNQNNLKSIEDTNNFTLTTIPNKGKNNAIVSDTMLADSKIIVNTSIEGKIDSKKVIDEVIKKIENNNGYITSYDSLDSDNYVYIYSRVNKKDSSKIIDSIKDIINEIKINYDNEDISKEYEEVKSTINLLQSNILEMEEEIKNNSNSNLKDELTETKEELEIYYKLLNKYNEMINTSKINIKLKHIK